ncbi:phage holin family protein [Glutamicibacter sp. MNS18]|uniref:phage holin family protein n=1 Tax=Glutamicibacter sp. MNS18 TaxID=2989817 RepID=UPI00223557A0|nr:phage holin family protein [Glutamicibacter sp. MNS18]MCW4467318.1 phage holin family protein [Glutamicibacter sp. MNS18]
MIRTLIYFATSALGLLAATWLLPDFRMQLQGFVIAVVVFSITQSVFTPFIARMTNRYAPAALGGIGLLSTWVSLFLANLLPGGLTITGWRTWVLAALVVWMSSTLAAWLLPMFLLKKRLAARKERPATGIASA